jgi:hypothetical protein
MTTAETIAACWLWLACSVLSYGWFNGNLEADRPAGCKPAVVTCAIISVFGPIALAGSAVLKLMSWMVQGRSNAGFWSYRAFSLRSRRD